MSCPDPRPLEQEIRSKLSVAKRGGGYIYHCDHSIPKNVSFQQYLRVLALVRQHGRFDGPEGEPPGEGTGPTIPVPHRDSCRPGALTGRA
jgi:hypothetical protein